MKDFLQVGDIIELKRGHKVYVKIPCHFYAANRVGDFEKCSEHDITIGDPGIGFSTDFMLCKWIVSGTRTEQGGKGQGAGDIYPHGHHVFCRRMLKAEERFDYQMEINFFQSGCFTAMIRPREIEVVGKINMDNLEVGTAKFLRSKSG